MVKYVRNKKKKIARTTPKSLHDRQKGRGIGRERDREGGTQRGGEGERETERR